MTKPSRRHLPAQMVREIKGADRGLVGGGDVGAVLRQLSPTEARYFRWLKRFGCLKTEPAQERKQLEKQNSQLRKILAEAELEKAVLKELPEGNS